MKKLFTLTAILFCYVNNPIWAGSITVTDASRVAANFYNLQTKNTATHSQASANLVYTQTDESNQIVFYVFDMSPAKGFVITAADDRVIPILAYSTENGFNTNFKHTGLINWINKTTANISLALKNNVTAGGQITTQWNAYRAGLNPVTAKSNTVGPLVTTTWDQENDISNPPPYLYNLLCPWNNSDQQRCLTGCVATAQSQIMKYWNYPATGTGSFTYTDNTANGYSNNYGTLSANFAAHAYQWGLMPSILTGGEPLAQDSAVDVLMYDCAVSVGMDFGDDNQDGSGAEALLELEVQYYGDSACSQYALVNYFSYNRDSIKGVLESSYNAANWTALVKRELNMGRPVLYEGDDASQGGHAWVCDGYDASNNLHMNWGWSGFDNGFFAINNLTTSGNFNPVQDDAALIGILPQYGHAPVTNFKASLTNACNGNVQFTDFSQDLPTTWLWNFGDGTTSALQNPLHTYTANGTYTVTLTAGNPSGQVTETKTAYIVINMPAAPVVTNVSAASPQSFSLLANTANNVAWFDSSGTQVSSANPFVTPVLNTTTTYWVQDSVASPAYHTGAANKQIGNGGYVTDPYALVFTVLNPCVIQSVYVYAQTAANRTIEVLDSTGHVVAQTTVYCPTGGSRVAVNLTVDAGGPYLIQTADTLGLYSNSSGGVYPYADSAGLVSITGNTALDNGYYYFYDWVVKSPDCVSPKVPVTASIETAIDEPGTNITFNMYPNPAHNAVILQTSETGNNITWNIKTIIGQTLISKTSTSGETHIDINNLAAGIYLVELKAGQQTAVKKLLVTQ